jgi:hypothetical protein
MSDLKHIAFKCNYCDGGEDRFVGFSDTCTAMVMKANVEHGHAFCKDASPCTEYVAKGLKGRPPAEPCYESGLFNNWVFGGGHRGDKNIILHQTAPGRIALLTTRFLDSNGWQEPERDRRIIGLFRIGKIKNEQDEASMVQADHDVRIRLPIDEARELYFWDYYRYESDPKLVMWGPGLVRYMEDNELAGVLYDLRDTVKDDKTRGLIRQLIDTDFAGVKPVFHGPRRTGGQERTARVWAQRKYGPGGEGKEHKQLKRWVFDNWSVLGLPQQTYRKEEHLFLSGDSADVAFKFADGTAAAVEVEVDSYWTLQGAHQALKYRTLMCAELGLPIDSPKVRGFLVAPESSGEARAFCRKYGIKCYEKKL